MGTTYVCNKRCSMFDSLVFIQNKAFKIMWKLPIHYPTTSFCMDVCGMVLPINGLYEYQVLVYVFQAFYNVGLSIVSYLQNQLHFNATSVGNLTIPRCRDERTKYFAF